ncbi:MAG: hypothetical protein ACRCTI_04700 [Beijerinckiaceae bacterium]
MLLSAILTELSDETAADEALVSLGDLALMAQVDDVRAAHEETRGEYVSGAAQRFARRAGDEDWLKLMTAIERAESPAAVCLETMVRWSIAEDRKEAVRASQPAGCGCGGGGGGCDGHADALHRS